ncbi:zinc finger MYM-type protein 1-like protein [Tanacetum coccineum]
MTGVGVSDGDLEVKNLHQYQVDVLYSVIDMQLQELNHRFNEVNTRLLVCMSSLCATKSFEAFKVEDLIELATFYLEEFQTPYDSLELELKQYIVDVSGDKEFATLKDIKDLCKKMVETKKNKIYPNVYLLIKLVLILSVATSTVERAFSAMKLIKSDLRNKLGGDFMHDCLVSYVEKDILEGISNDTIMARFQAIKPRKTQNEDGTMVVEHQSCNSGSGWEVWTVEVEEEDG